ncbi:hypothetical protein BJX63DRAFT_321546 [Aspergillus granulosus]|uniref:Uncharacterized protein n=1 Tax=Aspergillus granulosus TaxID=176169 RepID=A0ABR4H5Y7_9EURO
MLEDERNLAALELAMSSATHIVQLVTRFIQRRRYWRYSRRRSFGRCFTYSWWGVRGMWAQRLASFSTRTLRSDRSRNPRHPTDLRSTLRFFHFPVITSNKVCSGGTNN